MDPVDSHEEVVPPLVQDEQAEHLEEAAYNSEVHLGEESKKVHVEQKVESPKKNDQILAFENASKYVPETLLIDNPFAHIPFEQHPAIKHFFDGELKKPYNKYCVDCMRGLSTHASVTFGIYICTDCAEIHRHNMGLEKSYTKSCYNEFWDMHQLRSMSSSGGNENWHALIQDYNLEKYEISSRYKSQAANYRKRLV